jgi:hypothetical protein
LERYRLVFRFRQAVIILLVALVVVALSGCAGNVTVTPTGNNSTSNPTVKATPAGQATAGKTAVPAQEWYATARAAAAGWNADVFLYDISGTNKEYPADLPVDGKCREWSYDFISPTAGIIQTITIRDGEIISTYNGSEGTGDAWNKVLTDPHFRINNWTIDSPAAAITANEKFRQVNGKEPSGQVMYGLNQDSVSTDEFRLIWTINYDVSAGPKDHAAPVNIYKVDADTGSIIN